MWLIWWWNFRGYQVNVSFPEQNDVSLWYFEKTDKGWWRKLYGRRLELSRQQINRPEYCLGEQEQERYFTLKSEWQDFDRASWILEVLNWSSDKQELISVCFPWDKSSMHGGSVSQFSQSLCVYMCMSLI